MNQCPECEKPKYVKCCHNCKKDAGKYEVYHACGDDCSEREEMTKTNADRIRAMSDEEMAIWMTSIRLDTINEMCKKFDVEIEMPIPTVENTADVCEWLKQPVEE